MSEPSGVDDLDSLGLLPRNLTELVAHYAADVSDLRVVDEILAGLGEVPAELYAEVSAPPKLAQHLKSIPSPEPEPETQPEAEDGQEEPELGERRGPESGEISLGTPPARKQPSSGELGLDDEQPQSGSFQLPDVEDDGAAEDPAAAMHEAMSSQLSQPPPRIEQALDAAQLDPRGVGVAEEGSPVVAGDDELEGEDTEQTLVLDADDFLAAKTPENAAASASAPSDVVASDDLAVAEDRADADFDAMFDELTSPSSAPPPPPAAQDIDVYVAGVDYEEDEADATAVFDSAHFADVPIKPRSTPPPAATGASYDALADDVDDIEELDLDELGDDLEILVDEDDTAATVPPSKGEGDKRPSLIGRLLGRKEPDEE